MKKTILLILSLVFLGCASQLSFNRISQIDLDQCELKETVKDYNQKSELEEFRNNLSKKEDPSDALPF